MIDLVQSNKVKIKKLRSVKFPYLSLVYNFNP